MRKALGLVVVSIALGVGCAGAPAATPSGIKGTVSKSPITPVCREGTPCSGPAAGVKLEFLRRGARVATTTTSKAGTYRVVLKPGIYVVRTLGKLRFGSPQPRTGRVRAARFAVVNLQIDTGIR